MKLSRRSVVKIAAGGILSASVLGRPAVLRAAAPIRVGTIRTPHWAAVWDIGSFMPAAQTIDLVEFKTSLEMIAALAAGSLDVATIGYWHTIRMLDQGADVQAVAGICSGGSRVIVRNGIAVTDWASLRGRPCSVARGSTQDLQFLLALKNSGLGIKDVDYKDLGGNMAVHVSALQQAQVDAASMWEPFASQAVQQGFGTELPGIYEKSFSANGIMVATTATIDKLGDQIKAVVAAHVQATDSLVKDPDKYLAQATKLSGFSRETMVMANKNTELEYLLRKADARKIAGVANDFAYAKSNVAAKLDTAFNYTFLQAATGKTAAELGA